MSDISYFDFVCEKEEFNKKYLKYLPPLYLKVILLKCRPKYTLQKIAEEMNINKSFGRPYTPSKISTLLMNARSKLFKIEYYAKMFEVDNSIAPESLENLQKQVDDFYNDINDKDRL